MMKVVLIVPPNYAAIDDRLEPHLGLLYVAAVLLKRGFRVEYCDLEGVAECDWRIPESDVYGITVYGVTLGHARKIAAICKKKNPAALVVVGGPQPSGLPERTLEMEPNFDCAVVHEGEFAFLEAIADWGKKKIYRKSVPDLDVLPWPARHLADFSTYSRTVMGKPSMSLVTQRGCPFSCHFCANDRLFGSFRARGVDDVLAEIKSLIDGHGCRNFYFHDNIISVDLRRYHRLLDGIAPLGVEWFAYDDCRGMYSVEEYRRWYDAGCRVIFLGVESGSDRLLKKMNKRQTREKIRRTILNMQAAGIEARCALLFGYPGETRETWEETRRLVEEIQPAQVFVSYFVPFSGTEIFRSPEKFGITEMDAGFDNHSSNNKYGYGIGTFSTDVLSRQEFSALSHEVTAWWKDYMRAHPAKGAPAWTSKILHMMGQGQDHRYSDSTAMEMDGSPIIARS